jgi:hypothetical protein
VIHITDEQAELIVGALFLAESEMVSSAKTWARKKMVDSAEACKNEADRFYKLRCELNALLDKKEA